MDDATTNPLYTEPINQVYNPLRTSQETLQIADPLKLEIEDDELEKIITKRIKASEDFYERKYNLKERRRKNEKYLFGRQLQDKERTMKDYETRSSDNALYEIEASLKPLAMSKVPDIIVTPGGEDPDRIESAKNLTLVIDDANKKREVRSTAALGFKHLPVYFTGVAKVKWNPDKSKAGDSDFFIVNPEYVVVDHTSTSKDPDCMGFIAQIDPTSVQDLIMRFPNKKEKLFEALQRNGIMVGTEPDWKDMGSEVKIWEVWFDWYKRKGKDELLNMDQANYQSLLEPGLKWERVSGVLWKYDDVILDKMLDPNFDHEGEQKLFTYQDPSNEATKQEVDPQELVMAQLMGQPMPQIAQEQVYHNYFDRPHKPFYFFGYDQWGKIAYDETSRIEQNVRNQENLDDQNKTILDQIKKRMKHIWSTDSGLDKGAVQRMDMDDPRMDAMVEGDPNKVHKGIEPERPDAAQFNALNDVRSRMYAISGSTAVRGKLQSDVATTNQIAREADFTRSDDLVEDTINSFYEWVAQWQLQFIKLRYTEEHMKEILGQKGEMTYIRLKRDTVSDGMEVMIKASSTDKLKAQRNAMDTAKLGPPFTNPLDFFKDMDMPDSEGRTERGMMFAIDPPGYYAKYVMGMKNTQRMAGAIAAPPPEMGGVLPQAGMPPQGAPVPPQAPPQPAPQAPSPQNTSAVPIEQPAFPQGSPRAL